MTFRLHSVRYGGAMVSLSRRVYLAAAMGAVLAAALPLSARPGERHGIDPATIDRSASPTTDFFQYANGKWLEKAKIPGDLTGVGAFQELADRNTAILHQIADRAAADQSAPADSPRRKVGEFYRVALDTALADRLGAQPLAPEIARITGVTDNAGLLAEIAHLHRMGVTAGFGAFVRQDAKNSEQQILQLSQGGLGLPDRDYYLRDDIKSAQIRKQYTDYAARLLALTDDPSAITDADSILVLETRLARASMTRVAQRDPNATYHKMTVEELKAATPAIPWPRYFAELGKPDPGPLNIGQPDFFKEWNAALSDIPLAQWKTYLHFHLLRTYAPTLSKSFVDADFDYNRAFTGQKLMTPRWKRALRATDTSLGEALGQLYVAKAFPPQARQRALTLVQNLKGSLHDRILTLDWMGTETKAQAVRKLDAIRIKVGYPDKWRDYTGLTVSNDSYAQNVMRANTFEFQRRLDKIGKPVNRDEWGMTPPTVNAYYNPSLNEIVFPAGILQPPFFDPKADDASNYGGIGVVIGHEMTHGFDDQGRKFDSAGNLQDWWTVEDAQRFASRANALADQYSGYVAVDDMHVNGKLTLGENIADLGGLTIAYVALEKTLEGKPRPAPIDGYTPEQRFFLSFGQIWRSKLTPERVRLLTQTDPHSPGRWRVNGTLANAPGFNEAFGSGSGAAPSSTPIRIW